MVSFDCDLEFIEKSFYGRETMSFLQCWSTNDLEENSIVIYLRYAVSSVHIFQFIFAYVMLAAAIMTM